MVSILREACMRAGIKVPPVDVVVDGMQNGLAVASQTDLLTICNKSMLQHPVAAGLERLETGLDLRAPPLALFYRRENQTLPAVQLVRRLIADGI